MSGQDCTATNELRIVFAGTPDFSADQLKALVNAGCNIIAVYSQPDRRTGRGKKVSPSPVKALALEHDLPVYQPLSLRDAQAQEQLASLSPDVMVVVAYGLLLPQSVLDIPRYGCLNIHASLLPRWRGAAPIERAIEAGDTQTGITIMQMDAGLDTGAILHTVTCPIDDFTTGDSLREQLSELSSNALRATLLRVAQGQLVPVTQDNRLSCYAEKLDKEEAWLDWTRPALALARKVRAFRSASVTCTGLGGERIKIWMAQHVDASAEQPPGTIIGSDNHSIRVACGQGVLAITELQLPGRRALPAGAVLNARKQLFQVGQRFESHIDNHHGH